MTRCPKCGSDRIVGPAYDAGLDRLRYKCWCCGYIETTPTLDKKHKSDRCPWCGEPPGSAACQKRHP